MYVQSKFEQSKSKVEKEERIVSKQGYPGELFVSSDDPGPAANPSQPDEA
jgi:hypothetical protein